MNAFDIGDIRELLPLADGPELSLDVYREVGFFVVRNVIPEDQVKEWQSAWNRLHMDQLKDREVDVWNPVMVHEKLPPVLAEIHKCPQVLDLMQQVYPDLALYMQRFVIKDHNSRGPVFVHQDFPYDYGWPEKTTTFIPLSVSNTTNGGISFYPGTHHFGYLGDVGEIDTSMIRDDWPLVTPDLKPGDIALAHTCTWHCSPPHEGGPDRILVQSTFQPSSDPSSTSLLRGEWKTRFRLGGKIPRDKFFIRCRSSRIRELQAQVDSPGEP